MVHTTTLEKEVESFLKAWDVYLVETKAIFFLETLCKRKGLSDSLPAKFNSLKKVDKYFHSYIRSIVERFFKRNSCIHRNCGQREDLDIYYKYADKCPYLLKPVVVGKQEPVPPRLKICRTIESREDVWLIVREHPAIHKNLTGFIGELVNQWTAYQHLILALAERDEAVLSCMFEDNMKKSGIPTGSAVPPRLKLVRDGSMVYWGDQLLPINGKHFDILYKLARRPGDVVVHLELYNLIESEHHKEPLLRQYISNIRKAFPPPYSALPF